MSKMETSKGKQKNKNIYKFYNNVNPCKKKIKNMREFLFNKEVHNPFIS